MISTAEVGARLGIRRQTVQKLMARGLAEPTHRGRKQGAAHRWEESDVHALAAALHLLGAIDGLRIAAARQIAHAPPKAGGVLAVGPKGCAAGLGRRPAEAILRSLGSPVILVDLPRNGAR